MTRSNTPSGVRRARPTGRSRLAVPDATPVFDGYPYLVTRVGTLLRHLVVLPAGWSRDRLIDLAICQAAMNQLPACVCFGPGDVVYAEPGGSRHDDDAVPAGIPVIDRLVPVERPLRSVELAGRERDLRAYVEQNAGSGYLVGDGLPAEAGRPATIPEIGRLSAPGTDRLPAGLWLCPACHEPRGEFLARRGEGNGDPRPRILSVHCRCDNHNRCAGCGRTLAAHRLGAWHWREDSQSVGYLAAYCGLAHRCREHA